MRSSKHRTAAIAALVLAIGTARVFGQESEDAVETWLDRMSLAVEERNYRGTYVHVVDDNAQTLHIVHRFADGEVRERISSPGEAGREILRTGNVVRSVFPEQRRVVIEEVQGSSIALASAVDYTAELESYYEMSSFPKGREAGRNTQVVSIRARDEYRYGYLLWLDRETGLPLKTEVRDDKGKVVELIMFTEIEYVDAIPESEVEPTIDVEGFALQRPIKAGLEEAPSTDMWRASRLPNGFYLSISRQSLLAGSKYPVQQLVYTDGLATVSVFISHPKSDFDMPEGFSGAGSANAFSLKVDGRFVTALGEVPRRTVQRIATSLDAR